VAQHRQQQKIAHPALSSKQAIGADRGRHFRIVATSADAAPVACQRSIRLALFE